ncbi:U3 small nucleolar RNA-associated protein 4 homolog isoform X10 [Pipistrellus kuhlii]|uniref:U3 small nucleolar RNA-associated protein 4 homolog isoform X10 n=1 Tax=Pipistrellus kuhlii TaxID=59472 RepID=UPI001E271FE5|nr:U3 small nucleolar RNA-associated protein 4 homolog isoform X10 [Pipistrellus kuhlii]
MGEFKVHRVRFFNYVPSGIRCVAYNNQSNRLAVSRTDGTVEIYNLSANYFQEKFFPGHESRATEALCWAKGQRLFSAGLNGEIIEYDLQALDIKYSMDAFGGPIWSMAASPSGSQLLVGCEDGSVKLFQINPDKIQFERNFDRQKSRILSLSWHPSGTHIAAGSIDYISVFDIKSGSAVHKMLVDRQYMGVSKRKCIIWGVAFLSDGTVISVDSAGKVQFWDSATGTLVKTHLVANADVQSIAVSDQEDSFVVGTAEGTVFHFQLVSVTSNSSEKQWVRTKPFQHHTHDVRTVAHSPTALISGGTDTHLVIRPLMEKVEVKNYDAALRKITFPHRRLISCSKKRQLLLFQFSHHLDLWRLGSTVATESPFYPGMTLEEKIYTNNLSLKRKNLREISCSRKAWGYPSTLQRCRSFTAAQNKGTVESMCLLAVSPDGNWLAASGTSAGVHVYSVKRLKIFEYSIPDKQYTEWSRAIQKQGFHHHWLQRDTPITHIGFHPKRPAHILLHDAYMFCIIDKSLPLPNDKTLLYNPLPPTNESDVIRRRTAHAFKISKKYKPLLFMDLLDEGTLVAVERPLDDIIAQLPPPIKKKKFGT